MGRKAQNLKSLYLTEGELTEHNWNLFQKYQQMKAEIEYETYQIEDADLVVVSFGSVARIIKSSIEMAREQGMKVGLFRPITLYPYPEAAPGIVPPNPPFFCGGTQHRPDGRGCQAVGGQRGGGGFLRPAARVDSDPE